MQSSAESPSLEQGTALPPLGPAPKVLLIWPRFVPSFWGFDGMLELMPADSVYPPLGLLTVAALCPPQWSLRLIDQNFETVEDADLLWADLVMVSGWRVQHDRMRDLLGRARAFGKRTMLGGPSASAEPDLWQDFTDHLVVGEPDEIFPEIARDIEQGTARRRYVPEEKPDITCTPVPRFDLLKQDRYLIMAVQISRGCPFTCEFCDIITIYGRRPRVKPPSQVLAELDRLYELGWRGRVSIASDNFVADHRKALELSQELEVWQRERSFPFTLNGEASMDLAQRPALIEAMVKANFWGVFIGIESPSHEALTETKKLQNLREDPLEAIRRIRAGGLWVSGGFIIGFDSDTADIFDRQQQFIERAAIAWAMTGFLVAMPTTALHKRLMEEGRLVEQMRVNANFKPPNFRTALPMEDLLHGGQWLLNALYAPRAFFDRALASLSGWGVTAHQSVPHQPRSFMLGVLFRSILEQGLRSRYRREYWRYLLRLVRTWRGHPVQMRQGLSLMVSAHHFIRYAQEVIAELEQELLLQGAEVSAPSAEEAAA